MKTSHVGLSAPKSLAPRTYSCGLGVSQHPLQDTVSEEGCVRLCSEEGYKALL